MDPYLAHAICQTLLRRGTGDDAVAQLGVSRAEFKKVYHAIEKKLPGVSLDLEKLMSGDPIECDPLIAQGNLAILRFDDLYRETLQAWLASRDAEVTFHKRSVTPGKIQDYSVTKETTEYGGKKALPNESLIDQAVNVTLAAFRIQATITHRREMLLNPASQQTSPVSPTRQRGEDTSHDPNLIGPTESLEPLQKGDSLLRGYHRITPLTEIKPISGFKLATTPPVKPTLPDERSVTVGQAPPDEPSTVGESTNQTCATADSFSSANCKPTPRSERSAEGQAPPDEKPNRASDSTSPDSPSTGYFPLPPYRNVQYLTSEVNDFIEQQTAAVHALPDESPSVTVGQALPDEPSAVDPSPVDEPSANSGATADSFSSTNCEPTPLTETTVGQAPPDEPSTENDPTNRSCDPTESEVPKGRPMPARGNAPSNQPEETPSPEKAPHKRTANTVAHSTAPEINSPREEEPVTPPPSATPSPPREPTSPPHPHWPKTTGHWPLLLHRRE